MVTRRVVQFLALVLPVVVAGFLLAFLFVPRAENSEMTLDVPADFALLDLNGEEVREVSIEEFFELDLENPTMLLMGGGDSGNGIKLVRVGVGHDDQGNTVVYKAKETLRPGDLGHDTTYRVDIDNASVSINYEVERFNWGFTYFLLLMAVCLVTWASWRLVHDHIIGNTNLD